MLSFPSFARVACCLIIIAGFMPAGLANAHENDSCFACRHKLTGDWGGRRSCFAENGIVFEGDLTHYYQGVASGGLQRRFRYGGHLDYLFTFDMDKLAGAQGMFLKVRGESQIGQFANRDTGALLATNTSGLLPSIGEQQTAVTELFVTQFLSERFALFGGKLQTFDGDMNAFAHGRGKTQFMNVSMVANPIAFRTIPYSSWGAGFIVLQDLEPIFSFTVIDPVDRATTFNLDDMFEEGATLVAEARLPTNYLGLPGHQLLGAVWSNRDTALLSQGSRLLLPIVGGPLATAPESWALYWNFDQYLVTDECDSSKGWGVFGRAAIADDDTNPLEWFLSFGVGGNVPWHGLENDTFGAGWFYSGVSGQLPGVLLRDAGQGVELFYNKQLSAWMHVTADVQIVDPARVGVDNSLLFGLRVKTDF